MMYRTAEHKELLDSFVDALAFYGSWSPAARKPLVDLYFLLGGKFELSNPSVARALLDCQENYWVTADTLWFIHRATLNLLAALPTKE